MYLPEEWLTPEARQRARIPATVRFQEKWRLALTLLRQIRAAGFEVTAVLGRCGIRRQRHPAPHAASTELPYALGVSSTLTVFRGTPRRRGAATDARPQPSAVAPPLTDDRRPEAVRAMAAALPARAWRRVTWRNGTNRPWAAHFAALRVTPAHDWRERRLAPEVWLLFERDLGSTPRIKAYLIDLPDTASLPSLVRLAHHRWAIEQQYQELKDELGLDHFEGRSFVGWHRHVVLTAMAYAWLQDERRRGGARLPTLPVARAVITEILTAHFFVTRPHYLRTMQKLAEINLRI